LIFGIYPRLINAIKSFDSAWIRGLVKFDLDVILHQPHFSFLLPLLMGIFAAILFFTRIVPLPVLIRTHPETVYGLFFGLILGSVLTLIVYKLGKPGLKFDLFLIGLIQFCCLFAGSWIVYQERPVAIIYVDEVFQTMSKDSFDFHEININEVLKLDNKIPAWVYVELPQDESERKKILTNQLNDGLIHARADLYRPYKENLQIILQENIDLTLVDEDIIKTLSDSGVLYYYKARYGIGYIEINKDTGDYIAIH